MDYSNLLNQAQVYGGEVGERKADEERKVDEKAAGEESIGSQLEQLGVPAGTAVAKVISKTEAGQRGIAAAKQAAQGAVDKVKQAVTGNTPAPADTPSATGGEPPGGEEGETPSGGDDGFIEDAPTGEIGGTAFPSSNLGAAATEEGATAGAEALGDAGAIAGAEGVAAGLDATGVLAPIGALISLFAPAVAGAIEMGNAHHETENESPPDLSGVGAPVYTPGLN